MYERFILIGVEDKKIMDIIIGGLQIKKIQLINQVMIIKLAYKLFIGQDCN